jgi:multidrug efflux pump subunit AcrB
MSAQNLNFSGWLARAFVTSKLTITFILGIIIIGVLAIFLTPREENPQILVPAAQVTVTLPGASAKEVEELVITPLEGIISEIKGIDHTYAAALNSVGSVVVEFKTGQPKELSLVKLYDRVMSNLKRLPADAGMPQVSSIDVDDVAILALTLTSPNYDDYALKRLADRMAERLHSLDNVSVVTVRGGHDREIRVEIDPDRMQAFGLTMAQVTNAFAASNISTPLKNTARNDTVEDIKLQGFYTSADEVRNQIVGQREGRPIYVKDIGTVKDGPPTEIDQFTRLSFGPGDERSKSMPREMPAVTITVAKKKDSNSVFVANSVLERVERMKKEFVPQDVQIVATRNDGKKANDAVNKLMEHLGISILSVSVVLLFFLGWREALIVTVTCPLVMMLTLAGDLLGGITINRVTLFGLILSLGLLVDGAIVVVENIHRHFAKIKPLDKCEAAVVASNEIGNATLLATLTVMVVFLSMLEMTGMPGQYFFPVTINVAVAMGMSFLVAFIVVPWAANLWLPVGEGHNPDKAQGSNPLRRMYMPLISALLERPAVARWFGISLVVMMLLSAMHGAWQFIRPSGVGGAQSFFGVNLGFLPKDNKNSFNIVISMPESSPAERTDRLTRELGQVLAQEKYVKNYQTWVGESGVADSNARKQATADRQGSYVGEILVNLVDKKERGPTSIEIVRQLRPKLYEVRNRFPGAKVRLVEDPPGPPTRATVLAEIHGPDPEGLRTMSDQVSAAFANTWDIVDMSDSEPVDVLEHQIVPDKEKAALSGISVDQIARTLRLIYGGENVSRAHLPDEKNPVNVRAFVPRRLEVDPARLDRIYVDNVQGRPVPLSELVKVLPGAADRPIQHKDNERVTYVGGELSKSVPIYAVLDLNKRLNGMKAPDGRPLHTGNMTFNPQVPDTVDGYQLLWDGEMRMTLDVYRDMTYALGTSIILIFLTLVGYYRSFVIPLIAMSAVPLGIIGILPGHWLLRADFSATSMIGIIALAGVVLRSSLLIIDFIKDNLKQGMDLEEAVREAGAVRLRPILLTTLAIILGSAIMVEDPGFGGLAISLIFGSLVSTTLTVFVVPLMFYKYEMHMLAKSSR